MVKFTASYTLAASRYVLRNLNYFINLAIIVLTYLFYISANINKKKI